MTNAEKYLKDGVSVKEFARVILEETTFDPKQEDIIAFLNKSCKPQLTEDERAILKNIDKQFIKIGRSDENSIYFVFEDLQETEVKYYADVFANVFQFIKNGEEYPIEELLKGE